jgi:hypothetical protein
MTSIKTFMENGSNTGMFKTISRVNPSIHLTEVVEEHKLARRTNIQSKYDDQFNATQRSADEIEISISDIAISEREG